MPADSPDQSKTPSNKDERLDDLEIQFAYQQDTIDSLNETVTKQWDVIEKLRLKITRLEGRLMEMSEWQSAGNEPPPPHY